MNPWAYFLGQPCVRGLCFTDILWVTCHSLFSFCQLCLRMLTKQPKFKLRYVVANRKRTVSRDVSVYMCCHMQCTNQFCKHQSSGLTMFDKPVVYVTRGCYTDITDLIFFVLFMRALLMWSAVHRNSAASGLFVQAIHSRSECLSKVFNLHCCKFWAEIWTRTLS